MLGALAKNVGIPLVNSQIDWYSGIGEGLWRVWVCVCVKRVWIEVPWVRYVSGVHSVDLGLDACKS